MTAPLTPLSEKRLDRLEQFVAARPSDTPIRVNNADLTFGELRALIATARRVEQMHQNVAEYRAKLEGEAAIDVTMAEKANTPGDYALGRLDIGRSARRLEYFNELFPLESK